MCELLVWTLDRIGDNPEHDAWCPKRGDVVTVQEDGWPWGNKEVGVPHWQIVRVPGVSASAASAFTAEEPPVDPVNRNRLRRWRAFSYDFGTADPTTLEELLSRKGRKTPLVDPGVL